MTDPAITTRVALLQLLRDGDGYGRELIRRAERISGGRLRLTSARVYPALRSLEAARLIQGRRVSPGGTRGARSRTYYQLTPLGIALSTEQRDLLAAMVSRSAPTPPDAAERQRMAERVEEGAELSSVGASLHDAMRRQGRRP